MKALIYITPVDVQSGEQFWPGVFESRVRGNIETILAVAEEEGAEILDLAFSASPGDFNWRKDPYPNEHLNYEGGRALAGEVKRNILRILE